MTTSSLANRSASNSVLPQDKAPVLREGKTPDTALQIQQQKQFENAMAKGRGVHQQTDTQQYGLGLLSPQAGLFHGHSDLHNESLPPHLMALGGAGLYSSIDGKNHSHHNPQGLPLKASIGALISRLSQVEDDTKMALTNNVLTQSTPLSFNNGQQPSPMQESKSTMLVSKINIIQDLVATITPLTPKLADKQSMTLRVQMENAAPLEIQLSRQGNELAIAIKTSSADVLQNIANARQDLQYSLENKLPNTLVKIDMDLSEQTDRKSKGEYIAADEDELS